MLKIEVFTSPTCPNCPSAVSLVKEIGEEYKGVSIKQIDTSTRKGSKKAQKYGIMSVPTIILTSDKWDEIRAFRGTPKKIALENMVREGLGMEPLKKESKGFLGRLFGRN